MITIGKVSSAKKSKIKRLLDILISFTLLILLFPLFLLFSFLIKLDSKGPVIFKQKRLGKNGKSFTIYKFRSMYLGSPDLRNSDGSTYNSPNDQRLTKVGRFLREWSLDELLELFNVFMGDMSLVGPRPDQIDQIKLYIKKEKKRLSVNPGITGWAQLHGRNTIPWSKRKQLDLEYIENYSLFLDIKILINTLFYVLKRKDIFITENCNISK